MSTVFFTGQNQNTGATELYSVTSSSLGNLHDFLSPSSDIVTSIWQKRYVFLNDKYYDGMSSDVEKTDANTIVNRTVSMSEAKLRNKKTDDVKYRFTANGLKQFKKDEGISLLLKIDEYADEFVLRPAAEEIQLKPTARKILELIDKSPVGINRHVLHSEKIRPQHPSTPSCAGVEEDSTLFGKRSAVDVHHALVQVRHRPERMLELEIRHDSAVMITPDIISQFVVHNLPHQFDIVP